VVPVPRARPWLKHAEPNVSRYEEKIEVSCEYAAVLETLKLEAKIIQGSRPHAGCRGAGEAGL
jgi:hypothetical protein